MNGRKPGFRKFFTDENAFHRLILGGAMARQLWGVT
jgi:hypothetical protein